MSFWIPMLALIGLADASYLLYKKIKYLVFLVPLVWMAVLTVKFSVAFYLDFQYFMVRYTINLFIFTILIFFNGFYLAQCMVYVFSNVMMLVVIQNLEFLGTFRFSI